MSSSSIFEDPFLSSTLATAVVSVLFGSAWDLDLLLKVSKTFRICWYENSLCWIFENIKFWSLPFRRFFSLAAIFSIIHFFWNFSVSWFFPLPFSFPRVFPFPFLLRLITWSIFWSFSFSIFFFWPRSIPRSFPFGLFLFTPGRGIGITPFTLHLGQLLLFTLITLARFFFFLVLNFKLITESNMIFGNKFSKQRLKISWFIRTTSACYFERSKSTRRITVQNHMKMILFKLLNLFKLI